MRPLLYLIDGHAVAYRQFHGLPLASFSTPDGEPTNAVFGFTRILLDIIEKDRPRYLAVSFDMGMSGRDALYEPYKATREKMPDELRSQLVRIEQIVRAFNIPVLALDGYEADDVIGTVAEQALAEGVDVRIITGDRDLLQLLSDHVTVQLPSRDNTPDVVYDMAKFREKFQLEPSQLIDLKALMGDSSDNIPGVKGVGEKTAVRLLTEYGDLDGIYANLASIKGALNAKLTDGRELAYLSRGLATIQRDVPITLNLRDCVAHDYDAANVLAIFDQLNFRTLRNRLLDMNRMTTPSLFDAADFADDDAPTDSADFAPPARADALFRAVIVRTDDDLRALVQALASAPRIAFDVETTGLNQMLDEIVGVALATDIDTGYYIPVGHRGAQQLPLDQVIDAITPALTDPDKQKVAHNALYDLVMLQRHGLDVAPITFDTMLAEWLIDPLSKNLGLKNLAYARLKDADGRGVWMTPITDLIGTGKNQRSMAEVPIDQVAPYASADVVMTLRLVDVLQVELDTNNLTDLFRTLEMPLVPVLASMERAGIVLDTHHLAGMSQRLQAMLADIERDIYALSGGYGSFNINSPKQLNDVLFGKLGLPTKGLKKTTHGHSTDSATLEQLFDLHPIIPKIVEYRELSKLKGTYVDALPALINPHTGRVHTSYNQTGTSTGRLSSSDPNLQNIPIRTEIGREVRRAFVAPPGKCLLAVDYSQVELRILAHYSRDEALMEAFRQGQDIHKATAAAVFGIPLEQVTYEQRNFAKRVNFGLIYGMGAFRLARDSELTLQEANDFIERYFAQFPGVRRYLDDTKRAARQPEGLKTLFGRRRRFPALIEGRSNKTLLAAEERAAVNMPIQGSAADIIKRAMIDLYHALQREKLSALIVLQVHDELVLEVPADEIDRTRALVVRIMEDAYPLDPPLRVNAEVGDNWRDMS